MHSIHRTAHTRLRQRSLLVGEPSDWFASVADHGVVGALQGSISTECCFELAARRHHPHRHPRPRACCAVLTVSDEPCRCWALSAAGSEQWLRALQQPGVPTLVPQAALACTYRHITRQSCPRHLTHTAMVHESRIDLQIDSEAAILRAAGRYSSASLSRCAWRFRPAAKRGSSTM